MVTFAEIVAASDATTNIAFFVCVVSFIIAGGVAIYLLWDKIKQTQGGTRSKARIVRPKAAKSSVKKAAGPKKSTAKKSAAKKPASRKTAKRK